MFTLLINRWDFFAGLVIEHIELSLIAILIAIVFGGLVGILISEFQKSAKSTLNVINFLYTIPSISMLGFLIPFSGIGNATAIIALTIYALLPMVRNTHTGLTTIDPAIVEAATGMGSTPFQTLWKVKLPLAMPVILSGIRNMVTMTIALGGIASFIGAGGLGVAIYRGITTNNTSMTLAGSLLIALLALVADGILSIVEKRMKQHKKNKPLLITVLVICAIFITHLFFPYQQDTIHIATKPMTEEYIMGEMLKTLIEEDTNLKVEVTTGVGGGTSNIQPGMEKGEFDLYPEYTGTAWNMVLKKKGTYSEKLFSKLEKDYNKKYDMSWVGMYGFNNTYGLVVRKDLAQKYDLHTYSDLAAVSNQLTFGAEYDFFEREDGYDALCNAYGFHFASTKDMDIGLKYQAINNKQIDVMNIFTTDGQLSQADVVVLKDDKQFYPSYECGNVVRNEMLRKHPELRTVLKKLDNSISEAEMAKMNYQVETQKKEPKAVAKAFLERKHIQ